MRRVAVIPALTGLLVAVGCTSVPVATTRRPSEPALAVSATPLSTARTLAPTRPPELPSSVPVERETWRFAAYPGHLLRTENYRIHTTIDFERVLDRLPLFLECAMTQYTGSLARLPRPSEPMDTFIFRDRRQWTAKTKQLLPEHAGEFENLGRGGFSTRGISVLYYIDWAGRDRDTLAIASHEGWHQYTQSTFQNPLPIWLEEGIATYMEGYQFRRDDAVPRFEPGRNWERARALGEALRRDRTIALPELLRRSPQSFLAEGKDDLLTYYAQVWALVRFLTESEDGRYRHALAEVLTDAANGTLFSRLRRSPAVIARGGQRAMMGGRDGPWVILAYFTTDIATFNQEYLEFARSIAR